MPKKTAKESGVKKESKEKKSKKKEEEKEEKIEGVPSKNLLILSNLRSFDAGFLNEFEPVLVPENEENNDSKLIFKIKSADESSNLSEYETQNRIEAHHFDCVNGIYFVPNGYRLKAGKSVEPSLSASFAVNQEEIPFGLAQIQLKKELELIFKLKETRRGKFADSHFVVQGMKLYPRSFAVQIHALTSLLSFFVSNVTTREDCKKTGCECPSLFTPPNYVSLSASVKSETQLEDISKLVGDPEANRSDFFAFGGLDVLWMSLNTFSNQPYLLVLVYDILSQLSVKIDVFESIYKKGFLDRAMQFLREFAPVNAHGAKAAFIPQLIDSLLGFIWNSICSIGMLLFFSHCSWNAFATSFLRPASSSSSSSF